MPRNLSIALCGTACWLALNTACSAAPVAKDVRTLQPSVVTPSNEATYSDRVETYCKSQGVTEAGLCAEWRSAAAAEKAVIEARNARWLTVSALLLNGLGLVFVFLSLRQTNETFVTSNRPHLRMRRFRAVSINRLNEPDTIRLEAVNWGRSKAKIVKSHVALEIGSKLPDAPEFWDYAPHQFNDKFEQATTSPGGKPDEGYVRPGDSVRLEIKELTDRQVQALNAGQLWVVGFISYCDSSGNWRQYHTDFARRVVGTRFKPSSDDDYEAAP